MLNDEECKRQALNSLARRPLSEYELGTKLRQKGFAADSVTQTLEYVLRRGYVNDLELARAVFNKCKKSGKYGVSAIRDRMRKRGLTDEVIGAVFSDTAGVDEFGTAVGLVERRFKIVNDDNKAKVMRFLAYRGFAKSTIMKVMEHLYGACFY